MVNENDFKGGSPWGSPPGGGNGSGRGGPRPPNIDEVVEILCVLGCNHVTCSIGVSKGIQKRLQRSL